MTSGSLRVDGVDVRELTHDALRARLGYVEQESPVLAGTLRDNLRLAMPDATEEQMRWLDELQRVAVTGETAYRARTQRVRADATADLERLTVPTLIVHSVGDRMNDFEHARVLASHVPDARLVPLQSSNHIVLEAEPAWPVFVEEVRKRPFGEGYDAAKGEYVNMIERGIIDPLKVTRSALENAASIATMILTTETLITEVPQPPAPAAAPAMPEY